MTTERVLRKTWDLFQKQWQFVALVSLISFGVSLVLVLVMGGSLAAGLGGLFAGSSGTDLPFGSLLSGVGLASLGLGALVALLVTPWLTGASAHAGKLALEGKTSSPWQPFQAALQQYGTYLLLTIVLGIALGIGFTLFIIPGLILAVLLGLSPTIVAFEGVGVNQALQRAWTIGRTHFWTILLVGVIVAAASLVLSLVLGWMPLVGSYVSALLGTFGALTLAVIYTEAK